MTDSIKGEVGGELDFWGDTQPRSPFSSAQTPRHISQTQLSTWYCNTPGISASARLGEKVGLGSAQTRVEEELSSSSSLL